MGRRVRWAAELPAIRERAHRSRTETWSRADIEHLFGVSRVSAQTLMKAIGELETVAGAHFVARPALLAFLDAMLASPSVEAALRERLGEAEPPPRPKPLRVALPPDLRHAMMPDLPANITLEPGRLEIRASTAVSMLESLALLATILQNDLDRFRSVVEPPSLPDQDLQTLLHHLRAGQVSTR